MKREHLEYLMDKVDALKPFVQLGCRSDHHMEQEIFKKVNDDVLALREAMRQYLKTFNDSTGEE